MASVALFFVFRQLFSFVWDLAKLSAHEEWVVTVPDMVAVVAALGVYFLLVRHQKTNFFMNEVVLELSKVTWPLPRETVVSAVIVVFMVAIASAILSLFDSLWGTLTQKLLTF